MRVIIAQMVCLVTLTTTVTRTAPPPQTTHIGVLHPEVDGREGEGAVGAVLAGRPGQHRHRVVLPPQRLQELRWGPPLAVSLEDRGQDGGVDRPVGAAGP
jgi:hypothetical protein